MFSQQPLSGDKTIEKNLKSTNFIFYLNSLNYTILYPEENEDLKEYSFNLNNDQYLNL